MRYPFSALNHPFTTLFYPQILPKSRISILSWYTVAFEQDRGPLTMLDVEGFPIPWQWYVGHSRDKRLSLAAKAFLDFLRREGANIIP